MPTNRDRSEQKRERTLFEVSANSTRSADRHDFEVEGTMKEFHKEDDSYRRFLVIGHTSERRGKGFDRLDMEGQPNGLLFDV